MMKGQFAFLCRYRPPAATIYMERVVIAPNAAEAMAALGTDMAEIQVSRYEALGPLHDDTDAKLRAFNDLTDELQAIGEDFGVHGGEKRTDGIRRVLKTQRSTIDLLHTICERYEEGFADPGRFMDEIRDGLGRRDLLKVALREAVTTGTGVIVVEGDGKTTTRSMREMWGDGGVASSSQHQLRTEDVAKLREIGERCLALMRETPTHTRRRKLLADVHVSLVEASRKIEEALRHG